MVRKLKIGLALGSGGAKGFAHIGVLKVLHKHKIYPDYIAGTSMGAVIGAAYAAGRTPDDIAHFATSTDWKDIMDFTVPKSGLLQGKKVVDRINQLVSNKNFEQLELPLGVVTYNLNTNQSVVFSKGSVTQAVRASISIPGVFSPVKIGKNYYIDGGVADPTPFNVVREMGADIIIAVDLYHRDKIVKGSKVKSKSFYDELKEKFVITELKEIKKLIIPANWPSFLRKISNWLFDKLLYPARVIRIMSGRELPKIAKVTNNAIDILLNNLAQEKLDHGNVDIIVSPHFGHLGWTDFNHIEEFIKLGEKAMNDKVKLLKKKIR